MRAQRIMGYLCLPNDSEAVFPFYQEPVPDHFSNINEIHEARNIKR